jgi:hypothetical protein
MIGPAHTGIRLLGVPLAAFGGGWLYYTLQRFGGFVAKYMGDRVLVYFGYPLAHEDDAERAVRVGLELVAAVDDLKTHAALQTRGFIGLREADFGRVFPHTPIASRTASGLGAIAPGDHSRGPESAVAFGIDLGFQFN